MLATSIFSILTIVTHAQTGLLNGTGYAPNFTVTDLNGTSHEIYDYLDSGYVMVLELMSVTCGHCIAHAAGTENSYITNGPSGSNTASFAALTASAPSGMTATGEDDFVFFKGQPTKWKIHNFFFEKT